METVVTVKIPVHQAYVKIEADYVDDKQVICTFWCNECPLNSPPTGEEAYAVSACGQTPYEENCRYWQSYHLDKNKRIMVNCTHPDWTSNE